MIRFIPDTFWEGLLRPVAMAAPNSWVYVEIIAPDFRFLFAVLLGLACGLYACRGAVSGRVVARLSLFTVCGFGVWLLTSGNGRYGLPLLLLIGPLCIGLLYLLPWSRAYKGLAAGLMLVLQVFLIVDNEPWGWWGLTAWREAPYFDVEIPQDIAEAPATYVTLSSISYSLVAPRFHPDSKWINLSAPSAVTGMSRNALQTAGYLARAGSMKLLVPHRWGAANELPTIDTPLLAAFRDMLAPHGLSINDPEACRYLASPGLSGMAARKVEQQGSASPLRAGFWLCPLDRQSKVVRPRYVDEEVNLVFAAIERRCPRYFPSGSAATVPIPGGAMRSYAHSDTKLYVLDDATVMYKYIRSLNPGVIGTVTEVRSPNFDFSCDKIRGRGILQWE